MPLKTGMTEKQKPMKSYKGSMEQSHFCWLSELKHERGSWNYNKVEDMHEVAKTISEC